MKPEHLKLAGIVTMVCGGMSSLGAGAVGSESPTVATGRIIPMQSEPQSVTPTEDVVPVERAALDPEPALDVPAVPDVPATPATGGAQRDQAALKLGGAVDLATTLAHEVQAADPDAQASGAAVEREAVTPRAAQTDDEDPAWASPDLVAVNDSRLDNMRGGFDTPSGLVVSFGISRVAFVNGNLVASTSFNIPNIAQMTPQQAQMLANANAGALIQNGLNNTVQPGALPGLTGAVIQNTLSNQQIQMLTTINTTVNSLGAFKSLNLGQTLNSALLNAVPR